MVTSEAECVDALQEAAAQLDKSPTKAEYESLGLVPASATVIWVFGSWNEAKEQAGLETAPSTGNRFEPKPDNVEIPDDIEWENLSVDQRWHYRNAEHNTERTLDRRSRLRSWVNERKAENGCSRCGQTDAACLEYHHVNPELKEKAIGESFNLATGNDTKVIEMANMILERVDSDSEIEYTERRNWDNKKRIVGSIEKASTILGYQPQVTFEEGLDEVHDWFESNMDRIEASAEF